MTRECLVLSPVWYCIPGEPVAARATSNSTRYFSPLELLLIFSTEVKVLFCLCSH